MPKNSFAPPCYFKSECPWGRAVIQFLVTYTLVLHTHSKCFYFVGEFSQEQTISLVALRENQTFSAITGVTGHRP